MKNSQIIKKLSSMAKGVTAFGLLFCLSALPLMASSHREAPLTSIDPYADNTDVYAFRSYETGDPNTPATDRTGARGGSAYVTLIANFIPFQDPSGGPQFYRFDDNVLYEIHIDNTGDGLEDITYQFRFQTHVVSRTTVLGMNAFNQPDGVISTLDDPDYNTFQLYSVTRLTKVNGNVTSTFNTASNVRMPPSNIGPRTTPNYEQNLGRPSVHTVNAQGSRIFAGQRDEGFLVDVGGVFDGLNLSSGGREDCGGISTTDQFNVNTIAVEVPVQTLTRDGLAKTSATDNNAVIGVFATASRQSQRVLLGGGHQNNTGNFVQVSRLGNPLVNEVVVPQGLKDAFNSIRPHNDPSAPDVLAAVRNPELPKLLQARQFITHRPADPRHDFAAIFLYGIPNNSPAGAGFTTSLTDGQPHEMMRLNVGIGPTAVGNQNRLGLLGNDIAGYPNGRRVIDDVTDISLRVAAGGTVFTPETNIAPNNTLGDGVRFNDRSVDPITGNDPVSGGPVNDYLNRFPYLAPPHPGNTPRVSNLRACGS